MRSRVRQAKMFRARLADIERFVHRAGNRSVWRARGAYPGKGVYSGAHTHIVVGDEGTVWPMELNAAATGFRRWGDDGFNPATEAERKGSAGHRTKAYELKLPVGFAQCYRRQILLDKLPMVPVDFAVDNHQIRRSDQLDQRRRKVSSQVLRVWCAIKRESLQSLRTAADIERPTPGPKGNSVTETS
jgi:hypothetical protein